jgi:hypothetical protein
LFQSLEEAGLMRQLLLGTKWIAAIVGLVAGVLAVIAAVEGGTRTWLLHHAPAGWGVSLGFASVAVYLAAALLISRNDLKAVLPAAAESDRVLLVDRLAGWKLNDEVMTWLSEEFRPQWVPVDLYDQVRDHGIRWSGDTREFTSPALRSAFDELHEAVFQMCKKIDDELWFGDRPEGGPYYRRYLVASRSHSDDQYLAAMESIDSAARRVLAALTHLYAVAHQEHIDLSQAGLREGRDEDETDPAAGSA